MLVPLGRNYGSTLESLLLSTTGNSHARQRVAIALRDEQRPLMAVLA
jgi:hypothetical protein